MVDKFVTSLADYRSPGVFNPWGESDPDHDHDNRGPVVRRNQLFRYLHERIGSADTLLCAEAIGYQGGHFSGIPMTSERLLLGGLTHKKLYPDMVFNQLVPQRTSKPEVRPNGFTEPTATIVWGFFAEQGIDPRRVVLWNAFPWHPYHANRGLLTNRTPRDEELAAGHKVLQNLIEIGAFRNIVAIGEKSAAQLAQLHISAHKVRHPANGGAGKFRAQMQEILK